MIAIATLFPRLNRILWRMGFLRASIRSHKWMQMTRWRKPQSITLLSHMLTLAHDKHSMLFILVLTCVLRSGGVNVIDIDPYGTSQPFLVQAFKVTSSPFCFFLHITSTNIFFKDSTFLSLDIVVFFNAHSNCQDHQGRRSIVHYQHGFGSPL